MESSVIILEMKVIEQLFLERRWNPLPFTLLRSPSGSQIMWLYHVACVSGDSVQTEQRLLGKCGLLVKGYVVF